MRASSYAKALHEALLAHPHMEEKLLKQCAETVVANGHAYLFSRIIKSFARIVAKEEQATTIEVVSATPLTQEEVVALLKQEPFKHALSTRHRRVVRKTDSTIIGGTIVRTETTRIDASFKKSLQHIYQNFTNSL